MKAEHTSGPWYAARMGNDHQGLVVDEENGRNVAVAYDKADAHLIAAAPDMLEALEAIETCAADWQTDSALQRGLKMKGVATLARAAIANAKGVQP